MPPIPRPRWKMALISMEDIALNIRGHLHAGTLNIDQINSQLHPYGEVQLQTLVDYRSMEAQEESAHVELIREMALVKPKPGPSRRPSTKGKAPVRQRASIPKPTTPKQTTTKKVLTAGQRQSSRLKMHQENDSDPEFLFDLESAKDLVISPPTPKKKPGTANDIEEIKPSMVELEATSADMDNDKLPPLDTNASEPVSDETDPDVLPDIPISTESSINSTESPPMNAALDTITADPQIPATSKPAPNAPTQPIDTQTTEPSTTGSTSSQNTLSQGSHTESESSLESDTSKVIPKPGGSSTSATKPDELASPPASSTRSRTRPLSTTDPAPLRKYAILNGAKTGVRIKKEISSDSATLIPKPKQKTVPREANGRVMKRKDWPEDVVAKRSSPSVGAGTGTKSTSSVRTATKNVLKIKKNVQQRDLGAGTKNNVHSLPHYEADVQKPAKKPKLRLYLKPEPVD